MSCQDEARMHDDLYETMTAGCADALLDRSEIGRVAPCLMRSVDARPPVKRARFLVAPATVPRGRPRGPSQTF